MSKTCNNRETDFAVFFMFKQRERDKEGEKERGRQKNIEETNRKYIVSVCSHCP